MIRIQRLTPAQAREHKADLARVLVDCVEGGASVSFMAPFLMSDAERFFDSVIAEMERNARVLLTAFVDDQIAGTVQLITAMPPNQPHRAEVAKLLVTRNARSRGIGALLMRHLEEVARELGKTLLVLDTASGSAERIYARLGWNRLGVIPDYAMNPDGSWCDTTIFWKQLDKRSHSEAS